MWKWFLSMYYYFFPAAVKPKKYESNFTLDLTPENIVENEDNILLGVVEEDTPEGRVTLKYDANGQCFHYWSDKVKSYKYLETVARKYCILYNCRENYLNMFKELIKSMEAVKKIEPKVDDLFATFKNYENKTDNKIVNERANIYKWKGHSFRTIQKEPPKQIKYSDYKKNI